MLPPTILEESKVGQFIYRRYSVRSKVLEKSTHFGTLNAEEAKEKADHFLYMFHGGNGDDRQLVQEGIIGAIQGRALDLLVNRNIQIVLPFIGTSFLHDFPGDSSRAFAKHFFDELIPGLES